MSAIAKPIQDPEPRPDPSAPPPAAGARPRLLVLTPDFPPAHGGIQVQMHRLATGIEGFRTRVLTLGTNGAERFDATTDLETVRVAARGHGQARIAALNAAAVSQALRFRPEVILSGHIVTSPAAAVARRMVGARVVQYFYAKEIGARPRLAAFAAGQAHMSIPISAYTAELIAATGVSPQTTKIPPGVDLPVDASPLPAERPTVLTIARLEDRYKGHDVLLEALASMRERVPDVQWVVIGDGPLRGELEALAVARGVAESVSFLGAVDDQERNRWLRRCQVFTMPSRLPGAGRAGEGFGIVYLEAGAYGKPVVAGNVAGALDAVADGVSGLLVDPADPRALADAITRLLLDAPLAARLGAAGAERAREFAWPRVAERVQSVLLAQL
ncbi:MAG TPA: glycosyltransferase family 4 protein [Solirubrobacteraceae bacterium]|nr:glycosyltransferase family 4 protein [Solirubrobacteraceae bacterium]